MVENAQTSTLLVWPEAISGFTSSDAYHQVPLHLARASRTTLVARESAEPPPEMRDLFAARIGAPGPVKAFVDHAVREAVRLHPSSRFSRVVTQFDMRSIWAGHSVHKRLGIPWYAVCEDHPFGERYHPDRLKWYSGVEKRTYTLLRKFLNRSVEGIPLFINAGVIDFLEVPAAKLAPLSNCADLARLDPIRESAGPEEPMTIGYVGNVTADKGALEMAGAVCRLRQQVPAARLKLIGAVDPAFAEELRRTCPDGLEITGWLKPDDAMRVAARCSVCVHAYRNHPWLFHNQVLKLCEYMALGRAVVSVSTPGTRDLVRHEQEALLVPGTEPSARVEELAAALQRVLQDDGFRHQLASNGLTRVRSALNWGAMGPRFLRAIGIEENGS